MNNLPGNPYAEYAEAHMDPALATLALAYEIRTQTLISNPYADWNEIAARTTEET